MPPASWPVEIRAVGTASCGAVLWRHRGALHLTAIVKGTFAFAPGKAMRLAATQDELHAADVHEGGDVRRGLAAAGDLAPFRARADVVVTGSVYASAEDPARHLIVRLVVARAQALVDKTIHVLGDRASHGAPPAPFTQMHLGYERAFGGPGSRANPIGTGAAPGSPPPNLIDPRSPERPAGFGPIPRAWPARAGLLGPLYAAAIDAPTPDIPDDFDWSYFQAAPVDQRTEPLLGGDWIALENVYPARDALHTRLPDARGAARLVGLPGEELGRALSMNADALHVDTDRGTCSVTWRAAIELPDGVDPAKLCLVAGIELDGEPLALLAPALPRAQAGAPAPRSFESTMEIEPDEIIEVSAPIAKARSARPMEGTLDLTSAPLPGGSPLPFTPAGAGAPAARRPDADRKIAESAPRARDFEGTLDLTTAIAEGALLPFAPSPPTVKFDPAGGAGAPRSFEGTLDLTSAAAGPALPFTSTREEAPSAAVPPAAAPASTPPRAPPSFETTLAIDGGTLAGVNAPFAIATPGEPSAPSAPMPGAPWSEPSVPAPAAIGETTLPGDVDAPEPPPLLAEPPPALAEPPPAATEHAIAAPPPPAAEAVPEKPAWSWAAPDPAEAEMLRPAPAPARPQRPDLTDGLYQGFAKKKR